MGVKGLWEALQPVRSEVALSELKGQILAVDLSGWICQCKMIPKVHPLSAMFYRINNLMKLDVRLVFVMDGLAPLVKRQAMKNKSNSPLLKGRQLYNKSSIVRQAKELIKSFGLPCLEAPGEAEALMARLSSLGVVDGCLTQDGDALLYGAKRVYKNFNLDKQTDYVECYEMGNVEERLGLTREDLICMALLTGCDYDLQGVKFVGQDKALGLITHLKLHHPNPLKRMLSWRDCSELDEEIDSQSALFKQQHCGTCKHIGTVQIHRSSGCVICELEFGCLTSTDAPCPCPCDWHVTQRKLKDHQLEISIRQKALEYENFPNKEIVTEFLSSDTLPQPSFHWTKPKLKQVVAACSDIFHWSPAIVVSKFLPTLIFCDLSVLNNEFYYQDVQGEKIQELIQPVKILKSCRKDFIDCYEVAWKRLKSDVWSEFSLDEYKCLVPKDIFAKAFSKLAESFEESKPSKSTKKKNGKRKSSSDEGTSGSKITNFFTKKKLKMKGK